MSARYSKVTLKSFFINRCIDSKNRKLKVHARTRNDKVLFTNTNSRGTSRIHTTLSAQCPEEPHTFILYSLLSELKDEFATTEKGKEPSAWSLHTLLASIIPFSSSRTSNLLRVLPTLFIYIEIGKKRYYTFMVSPKLTGCP